MYCTPTCLLKNHETSDKHPLPPHPADKIQTVKHTTVTHYKRKKILEVKRHEKIFSVMSEQI